jgi:tetratricopeptide (TPR) repeat protein
VRLSGKDPVLSSKLGYTEVRLGRTKEGISRLKKAAETAPEVAEVRERLMKAFVAVNVLSEAAEQAEKLAILEGTAKAYLRAASIRVHANDQQQAREVLKRGITLFPDSVELRQALAELCGDPVAHRL